MGHGLTGSTYVMFQSAKYHRKNGAFSEHYRVAEGKAINGSGVDLDASP